jgi:hypothetical protein
LLFEIMRTSHIMGAPHIGLVAVHEVRHCSTNDNLILGVKIIGEENTRKFSFEKTRRPDLHMYYFGIGPLVKCLLEEELEPGSLDEPHGIAWRRGVSALCH